MRKRGVRWPFLWSFLFCFSLWSLAHGASSTPLLPHKDPVEEREFQNVYQTIQKSPSIFTGTGAPSVAPIKVGDIFINTANSKVYIATATATSGSWAILN